MINILIAGDFAPRHRAGDLIDDGRHDEVFGQVRPFADKAGYAIVNFECAVVISPASPIKKSGPNLKARVNAVDAIKRAGFDAVTLANNHFYDYGEGGVSDTLDCLDARGIDHLGGGRNLEEASRIHYKTIEGERFAFLNFCEREFSIATGNTGGANPLNPVSNYYQIREARQNADHVIVIVHGGHECYPLPSPRMKETYRFFIDAGADVVVNHHQHCFSGHEKYNGKYIFYGTGNFCFDDPREKNSAWNQGYMINIKFGDGDISFDLIPYAQCGETPRVEILPDKTAFNREMAALDAIIGDDLKLREAFDDLVARRRGMIKAFEPYNNRYLEAARSRGWVPSFFTGRKKRGVLNLVRCESHRDILLQVLENEK
jgi:poly-gamma-glutamate synthesis protein (capsule biosynthesis protein)